jgi:hypothetical protein
MNVFKETLKTLKTHYSIVGKTLIEEDFMEVIS